MQKAWRQIDDERKRITLLEGDLDSVRPDVSIRRAHEIVRAKRETARLEAVIKKLVKASENPSLSEEEKQPLKGAALLYKPVIERQRLVTENHDYTQEVRSIQDALDQAIVNQDALFEELTDCALILADIRDARNVVATFVRTYDALRIEFTASNNSRKYVIVTRSGAVEGPHLMKARSGTKGPD